MRRMQNVDKHPKSGFYRVRVTFPAHLQKIIGAGSATQSLKTRNANEARQLALPVLTAWQRRVDEAETVYQAEQAGEMAQLRFGIAEGVQLIEQWRDAYLAKSVAVFTTGRGRAGDYLALGDTPERDAAILKENAALLVELYYSGKPVSSEILDRTLNRILAPAGYVVPDRHRMRVALKNMLRQTIDTIRTREEGWRNGEWSSDTLPPIAPSIPPTVVPAASTELPPSDQMSLLPA